MGLTLQEKQAIRDKVRANNPLPPAVQNTKPASSINEAVVADELTIEVLGSGGCAEITLRSHEVSRLRGRYGPGPGFEQWVTDRVRDSLNSLGGC